MTQREAWETFKAVCPGLPLDDDFVERLGNSVFEESKPVFGIGGEDTTDLVVYKN